MPQSPLTYDEIMAEENSHRLARECLRLRQALWDVALIAGADGDGNKTPDALTSDIVEFATGAVQDLRDGYDDTMHTGWEG